MLRLLQASDHAVTVQRACSCDLGSRVLLVCRLWQGYACLAEVVPDAGQL